MAFKELFKHWTYQAFAPGTLLRNKYNAFRELLRLDDACLQRIAELEEIHYGREQADWARVMWLTEGLAEDVRGLAAQLQAMNPVTYMDIMDYCTKIIFYVRMAVSVPEPVIQPPFVFPLIEALQHPSAAGGKALNLARMAQTDSVPVPEAAVVSASVFHYYLEANALREQIDDRLRRVRLVDPADLHQLAEEMQLLILEGEMPDILANEIEIAALELGRGGKPLAVRSSAVAEDGEASFAGQYDSVLNVPSADIIKAWKEVVASKYSARAIAYRIMHGFADAETPMAVLIMPMVEAQAAGVMYTRDPQHTKGLPRPDLPYGALSIYGVEGAGSALVDGSAVPQLALLSRRDKHRLIDRPPAHVLPAPTLKRLAAFGMELETLFSCPQDVEWVLDNRNRLHIVQSRPVETISAQTSDSDSGSASTFTSAKSSAKSSGASSAESSGESFAALSAPRPMDSPLEPSGEAPADSGISVLLEHAVCASSGCAAGTVRVIPQCRDITDLPPDTILVTRNLGPALSRVMDRLSGVVAERGSIASHFASVAREFKLPVLVGVENATTTIPDGISATVDGNTGRLLEGEAPCAEHRSGGTFIRKSIGAMQRLDRAMPQIAKLNLTDPQAETFTPAYCRSLHDLVRFVHEKGVEEMFTLVGRSGRGLSGARKLKADIPVIMYVLNLEDGLFHTAVGRKEVTPDDIRSVPMWALWFGLSSPKVTWPDTLKHVDWEEFDRISAGIFSTDSPLLASYAVISQNYLHLMVRFGYHFSVVDCMCGGDERQNYINFRFKGGGGKPEQRLMRLEFIKRILDRFGFFTETKGDMLDARHPAEEDIIIQQRLAMLGFLLAKTRMMDMGLTQETQIDQLEASFLTDLEELAP